MPQRKPTQLSSNPIERVLGEMAVTIVKTARDIQDIERFEEQQPMFPCLRDLGADRTVVRYDYILNMDATSGNVTVTLPAVATSKGWGLWVKKVDSSANSVIVAAQASETINGASSYTIAEENESILCICNGTEWFIYSRYGKATTSRRVAMFMVDGTLAIATGALRIYNRFGIAATITEVYCSADTAPTGQSIKVDIHKNGTTIFTDQTKRPEIAASANTGSSVDIDVPSWASGEYLTMDVDQVGSGTAGSNLTVHIVCEL